MKYNPSYISNWLTPENDMEKEWLAYLFLSRRNDTKFLDCSQLHLKQDGRRTELDDFTFYQDLNNMNKWHDPDSESMTELECFKLAVAELSCRIDDAEFHYRSM